MEKERSTVHLYIYFFFLFASFVSHFFRLSIVDVFVGLNLLLMILFVVFFQFVFNLLIPDHNADVFNPPYDRNNNNVLDSIIHKVLGGFIRWDGVYFLHVAEYGYIYENSLAFFPLFPWSVRILANSLFWPLQFVIQYRTILILSGFLFNLFIHIKSTIVLFRLSKNILNSEFMAYQSAILFCFNPASIFFSAFYSETLFTYLTFSSMLMFEEKKKNLSLLYSGLSCVTRSNGLLTAGFEMHRTCQVIVNYILQRQIGYIDKFVSVLKGIVKLMVFLLIFLLPFVVYQFYISDLFCNKNVKWPIPDFLIEYGLQRNYNLITNTTFDWCKRRLPFSYSNVQNTHWNVGFLRYYEIKQIPNFILALPVSYFSISSILYYYRQNKGTCITLGFIPDSKDHHQTGFRRRQMLPYVVYLLFITIFGWVFMHIQVKFTTYFVFNMGPGGSIS